MGLIRKIQTRLEAHIEKEPNSKEPRLLKNRTLLLQGQADRALAELETYCASDAGRQAFEAQLELARALLNQGRLEESRQRIEQAAVLNPNSPALLHAHTDWATRLAQGGQHEQAVVPSRNCLPRHPTTAPSSTTTPGCYRINFGATTRPWP